MRALPHFASWSILSLGVLAYSGLYQFFMRWIVLALSKMVFFRAAHSVGEEEGVKKHPPPPPPCYNLWHTSYNDESWHNYTLPKKDPKKIINHVTHFMSSADISMFSPEIR